MVPGPQQSAVPTPDTDKRVNSTEVTVTCVRRLFQNFQACRLRRLFVTFDDDLCTRFSGAGWDARASQTIQPASRIAASAVAASLKCSAFQPSSRAASTLGRWSSRNTSSSGGAPKREAAS